ncbi:MAG: hypothetical protein DRJ10_19380 [Bacteroidetes bacterium]|nr:MAG: hypothetical protein DRJ10_19380 [Bacteroidota bacterium]
MSKSFLYHQQNNTQTDTIKKSDTIVSNTNFQNNFKNKLLISKDSSKSALFKQIEDGFDATSYIYSVSGEEPSLTNKFLNKSYFNQLPGNKVNLNSSIQEEDIVENSDTQFKLHENDYLLMMLILLTTLIAYVKLNGKSYLQRTLSSIISFRHSQVLYNERNKLFAINELLLLFVFHLSFGIFLISVVKHFNLPFDKDNKLFVYFSYMALNFVLIYIYKVSILLISKFVSTGKAASEYIFYFNNILILLGILNMIFLFGILFAPHNSVNLLIFSLFFIYVIAYITRAFKIISIFLTNRFSLFYMILYFCALEIIPILLIVKLFVPV